MLTLPPQATLLKDINGGAGASTPNSFVELAEDVLFFAQSGDGRELWKTDFTAAGTVQVKDIRSGGGSSVTLGSEEMVVTNGKAFFSADDGAGKELWVSDGTDVGTVKIDINASGSSNPQQFEVIGNLVLFVADNGINGRELWKSDGTAGGTQMVGEINSGGDAFVEFPSGLHLHTNGYVYFGADNGSIGRELWRSNGSTVELVADVNTFNSIDGGHSGPAWFESVGDALYFSAYSFEGGRELYRHYLNFGSYTTNRAASIWSGSNSSNPQWLTEVDGKLFFGASNTLGREPWVFTSSGATILKDINTNLFGSSTPVDAANSNGLVYFTANQDPTNGAEPWVTDGTAAGTRLLKDINPGAANDSNAVGFHPFNGYTFFTAVGPGSGNELYVSDGTTTGTQLFQQFNPGTGHGAAPFFYSNDTYMLLAAGSAATGLELSIIDTTNADPTANDDTASADQGETILIDVLDNDTDPEDGLLTIDSATMTSGEATLTIVEGDIEFEPGSYEYLGVGESEVLEFTYSISDPLGGTDSATVEVTVNGLNDEPEIGPISGPTDNVLFGQDLQYDVDVFDIDATDDHTFNWEVFDEDNNSVATGSEQDFEFTPTEYGTYTIEAYVSDGNGGEDSTQTTLTFAPLFLDGATAVAQGTNAKDSIKVALKGENYEFSVAGSKTLVPVDDIDFIQIHAFDGGDVITINSAIEIGTEIYGGRGADKITGGSGPDNVYGGPGNDKLNGKNGDDTLLGESGNDKLIGGNNRDELFGGDDNDNISGGNSQDYLSGGDGNDKMNGGKGLDIMYGDDGDDKLTGSGGNDEMFGNAGEDTLSGGGGNDLLVGGLDDDILKGGSGDNDLFQDDIP